MQADRVYLCDASPAIAGSAEQSLRTLSFSSVSEIWFTAHRRHLKPSTIRGYVCDLKVLKPFFGAMAVGAININHIRRYQEERSAKAGAYRINGEVRVLQMVLGEADCWEPLRKKYKPLRIPRGGAGHSLSQEEEDRLLAVAFSRTKWKLAGHCMKVMLSTTMGFGELSHLRRGDVDMERRSVTIRNGKNVYRERTIPLNASAYESMQWLIARWEKLGGSKDEQYILPHRPRSDKGPWLFNEHQTAMQSAIEGIRKEAGLPHFRIYDCRVQAITKLLSNPAVSPQVSKEIAGHITQAMQDRYSIQRFETKKAALDALDAAEQQAAPAATPPQRGAFSPQGWTGGGFYFSSTT